MQASPAIVAAINICEAFSGDRVQQLGFSGASCPSERRLSSSAKAES